MGSLGKRSGKIPSIPFWTYLETHFGILFGCDVQGEAPRFFASSMRQICYRVRASPSVQHVKFIIECKLSKFHDIFKLNVPSRNSNEVHFILGNFQHR